MKTLVTVSFALNLEEDELVNFAQMMDASLREGVQRQLFISGLDVSAIDEDELSELIDWYGTTLTPRRDMLEGIA